MKRIKTDRVRLLFFIVGIILLYYWLKDSNYSLAFKIQLILYEMGIYSPEIISIISFLIILLAILIILKIIKG